MFVSKRVVEEVWLPGKVLREAVDVGTKGFEGLVTDVVVSVVGNPDEVDRDCTGTD